MAVSGRISLLDATADKGSGDPESKGLLKIAPGADSSQKDQVARFSLSAAQGKRQPDAGLGYADTPSVADRLD